MSRQHATAVEPRSTVEDFLRHTADENPSLARGLSVLDERGRRELGGVLGRLEPRSGGPLGARERLLCRRILLRVRKPSAASFSLLNRALDYFDLDADGKLDEAELELGVRVLEVFARADSPNDTLSEKELRMLYACLRHLDSNHDGRLTGEELRHLGEAVRDPDAFLAAQRATNPRLREVLEGA